uniref:Neurexin-3-alpha n=1 Tax=Macrostomum lignano TaxID=282301 RepID=A0A1I8J9M4_9PLAT
MYRTRCNCTVGWYLNQGMCKPVVDLEAIVSSIVSGLSGSFVRSFRKNFTQALTLKVRNGTANITAGNSTKHQLQLQCFSVVGNDFFVPRSIG